MNLSRSAISIAVLAGGKSRRMGTDKALLRLTAEGPPLAAIVIDCLRDLSDDIFIVSAPRPGYDSFGVPVVPDRVADSGPLAAIDTALAAAKHETTLVVSCDMPFLCRPLIQWLIDQPRTFDVLIPAVTGESRHGQRLIFQPLHALYTKACREAIDRSLRKGDLRATSFLPSVNVEIVNQDVVHRFDPDERTFFSVNTPESIEIAQKVLGELLDFDENKSSTE